MKGPVIGTWAHRRQVLVGAGVAVAVVALLAAVLLFRGSAEEGSSAAADSATSPSPVSLAPVQPTPEPARRASDVNEAPASLSAVALDEAAQVGNGVTARVTRLEAIDGSGSGPGNIAGPALRVTIRITNGTADALSLDGVAVDLTSGADALPASPLEDPSVAPFRGSLAPGGNAEGIYVFSVPVDNREQVTVTVGYEAGAPFMVFTGPAR